MFLNRKFQKTENLQAGHLPFAQACGGGCGAWGPVSVLLTGMTLYGNIQ